MFYFLVFKVIIASDLYRVLKGFFYLTLCLNRLSYLSFFDFDLDFRFFIGLRVVDDFLKGGSDFRDMFHVGIDFSIGFSEFEGILVVAAFYKGFGIFKDITYGYVFPLGFKGLYAIFILGL